jgi:hypothetical protein
MTLTPYPDAVRQVLAGDRLNELGPGQPNNAMKPFLSSLTGNTLVAPRQVLDRPAAEACLAGLWLYHDFWDEAHRVSQDLATAEGSYWHGLVHRREPDAVNAAYWFRRVGAHPIFPALAIEAVAQGLQLAARKWDPFRFIELCEEQRGSGTAQEMLLRKVQQCEWDLLFDRCYRKAAHIH